MSHIIGHTGLDYRAWEPGPVPFDLFREWDRFQPDLASAVEVVPEQVIDYQRERVVPKVAFDNSHFTKRELRLMAELAVPDDDPNRDAILEAARDHESMVAASFN